MIVQGNRQYIEEYFADSAVNQSYLKQLLKGVKHIEVDEKKLYYEEKGHFIIGSAVDMILTEDPENYNNIFYASNLEKKPSPAIMSIVQKVFDNVEVPDMTYTLESYRDEILESCDIHLYQMKWKPDTRIDKVIKEGSEYFEDLYASRGKQIISHIEKNIIDNISTTLESHRFTRNYFTKHSDTLDILYQVPIYFTFMDISCKALLDIVIIDRENKTITPLDIKTTGGEVIQFKWAVGSYRYDFQAAFYREGLRSLIGDTVSGSTPVEAVGRLRDYTIEPFKFLVETTMTSNSVTAEGHAQTVYHQGNPLAFTLSEDRINIGLNGRPELTVIGGAFLPDVKSYPIKHREIPGVVQAIELYKWHKENGFEVDKEIVENQGDLLIE